jgi:hypothetical protein
MICLVHRQLMQTKQIRRLGRAATAILMRGIGAEGAIMRQQ